MDEARRLLALLDTCQQSLMVLERRRPTTEEKRLVAAVRDTCDDIEARLSELGVPFADRTTKIFDETLVVRG
jgi:hypothetical protein